MADYTIRIQLEPEDPEPTDSDWHEEAKRQTSDRTDIEINEIGPTFEYDDHQVVPAYVYVHKSAIPRQRKVFPWFQRR